MAKPILGIEIGTSRLKAAVVKNGIVTDFQTFDIPDDVVQAGAVVSFDALSEFIRTEVKKTMKVKQVALVLPDTAAYIRRVTLPAMTLDQLKVNLPYEFHDVITEGNAYQFDYSVIGTKTNEEGTPTELDLLAGAVSKELLEKYTIMFKKAGMKLVKAVPEEVALGSLVRASSIEENVDVAVLDLGYSGTRVSIFHNGVYEVTRSIDTGINDVINAIADSLNCDPHIARAYLKEDKDQVLECEGCTAIYASIAVEVMRAINYYTYENRDNNLENICFCGGGAWIRPLVEELANTVSLKMVALSEVADSLDVNGAITDGPNAVGVCLE